VLVAWVFFRAATLNGAWVLLTAMFSTPGPAASLPPLSQLVWLLGLTLACVGLPNAYELMARYQPANGSARHPRPPLVPLRFRLTPGWALAIGAVGALTLAHLERVSEFLYFQF
jgi:hypothetical protein